MNTKNTRNHPHRFYTQSEIITIGNSVPIFDFADSISNETPLATSLNKQWIFRARGSKTCKTCMQYDGKIYTDLSKAPQLPLHPNCKCYYEAFLSPEEYLKGLDRDFWALSGEIQKIDMEIVELNRLIEGAKKYRKKASRLSKDLYKHKLGDKLDFLKNANDAISGGKPEKGSKRIIPPVIDLVRDEIASISDDINKSAREDLKRAKKSHQDAIIDTRNIESAAQKQIDNLLKKRNLLLETKKQIMERMASLNSG